MGVDAVTRILGQWVAVTDEITGVSQLLGGMCPSCPPQVYAYDDACATVT